MKHVLIFWPTDKSISVIKCALIKRRSGNQVTVRWDRKVVHGFIIAESENVEWLNRFIVDIHGVITGFVDEDAGDEISGNNGDEGMINKNDEDVGHAVNLDHNEVGVGAADSISTDTDEEDDRSEIEGGADNHQEIVFVANNPVIAVNHDEDDDSSESYFTASSGTLSSDDNDEVVELQPGSKIYVDALDLKDITDRFKNNPREATRRLLLQIIGREDLMKMTLKGRNEKEAIPNNVDTTIRKFVSKITPKELRLTKFEHKKCITKFLTNLRASQPTQ
ncbi:hypothetical protein KQX54_001754 [Cotesia glomerata]|uniref:Uncharacterized protein n=1 Tax=Cotesia glomerata TaxID=32391 RepID=A0AAV7J1H3_COTGL|nr:hypothetical protein KQX54_001754 [Cotesia glomerata]